MQNIVLYLIKVVICSGVFYAYYLVALRNKNFHPYNRFYLLITAGLSFLLPLLHFSMFDISSDNEKMLAMMRLMYGRNLPDVVVGATRPNNDWQQLSLYDSLIVTTILLVLIVIRVIRIYQLKKAFPHQRVEEIDFINTDIENAPFSFMKNLFWRNDIELNDAIGEQIYRHEMAHIQQKHSLDKIFFQMLRAVFWMNPIYYFMQKELLLIHEFIADEKAVQDRNGEAFAQMLLRTQLGKFNFEPAHPLFYSNIKKRLIMITNFQKPKYSYVRRLVVLPLLGCVTFAFAFRVHKIDTKNKEIAMQSLINVLQQRDIPPIKDTSTQLLTLKFPALKENPLYVINGVPTNDKSALDAIPTNEIEKVDVLKGKSATSLYGTNAQGGAVLITTKNGLKNSSDTNKVQEVTITNIKKGTPPLVFVDRKKTSFDIMNSIPPSAIASINVLKDGKAIEKYGVEGKNGVIEITTKAKNLQDVIVVGYKTDSVPKDYPKVFFSVQHPATFPGGQGAWQKYLEQNLKSQIPSLNGSPTGNYPVIVSFLVSKNGDLSEVKVISAPKPDYGCAAEAVRVIKASGNWNPAIQNGRKVTYRQVQKITFSVTK